MDVLLLFTIFMATYCDLPGLFMHLSRCKLKQQTFSPIILLFFIMMLKKSADKSDILLLFNLFPLY